MAIEIERKFLVVGDAWRGLGAPVSIRQGYLSVDPLRTVRVRLADQRGTLTIKGKNAGLSRAEYEVEISVQDAQEMLEHLCLRPLLEKHRTRVHEGDHLWEVDEFFGENRGLIVAEVELRDETETLQLPAWVGAEVSDDVRYYNSNLQRHPFTRW